MSFQSCIKVPMTRYDNSPETSDFLDDSLFYELISVAHEVFGHGKWSHSVTNQTIDFLEYIMGRYYIGCAAFVKVQLNNGSYHEVMGYADTESSNKSFAVKSARINSITNGLQKALLCFGGSIEEKINNISKNGVGKINKKRKLSENQIEIINQSSKSPDTSVPSENIPKCVSTNSQKKKETTEVSSKSNGPHVNTVLKNSDVILPFVPAGMTEEEARQERKRRQKEKQEEFRRMMKEKDFKKMQDKDEIKPNSKF